MRAFILLIPTILLILGCSSSEGGSSNVVVNNLDPTRTLLPTPTSPLVPTSDPSVTLQPLASGLSVADMIDNAMRSVVRVVTQDGQGTGFVVGDGGLVITNSHVVVNGDEAEVVTNDGRVHRSQVTQRDPDMDIAYLTPYSMPDPPPAIAMGDSDALRLGAQVVIVGFPLGVSEPSVSMGIVSAMREGLIQTDAAMNPGNSGGPMLDSYGRVVGVVVARAEVDAGGNLLSGIGFAIPINVLRGLSAQPFSDEGQVVSTPTPFPTLKPTPDVAATRTAIEAIAEHRRQATEATQTAIKARQEAEAYAAALEATRVAGLPTVTPEPTNTPLPTPTPHPAVFCEEWQNMVLEWIWEGNSFVDLFEGNVVSAGRPRPPTHKRFRSRCILRLPIPYRENCARWRLSTGLGARR